VKARHRIGCNLLWVDPGQVGGSEEYCVRLLHAFAQRHDHHADLEVHLLVNRRVVEAHPALVDSFPVEVAPISGADKPSRILAENTWMVRAGRRLRLDLVHHLGGTMPFVRSCPGVVLIHDLQPWAFPEYFSATKRLYLRAMVPRSVRRARAVTTLSRWVQRDVSERLSVPLERMTPIPPGADDHEPPPVETTIAVLRRHGLEDRPFFLYPAITYRHKNHATLVRAFAEVNRNAPSTVLVLTGGEADAEHDVTRLTRSLGITEHVRRPGRIPAADLDVLYRSATALTFPSRYEGFGMPVLEAMSRHCPVVVGDVCALPEVVAQGGVLLPPDDPRAWSEAMLAMLDVDVRNQWATASGERAAEFRWDDAAVALAGLYRRLVSDPGSRR
jgi:glycosyltransferase involved in cell wall biosynthesis